MQQRRLGGILKINGRFENIVTHSFRSRYVSLSDWQPKDNLMTTPSFSWLIVMVLACWVYRSTMRKHITSTSKLQNKTMREPHIGSQFAMRSGWELGRNPLVHRLSTGWQHRLGTPLPCTS